MVPWTEGSAYIMPNLQEHGTRNLGRMIAGGVRWAEDPSGNLVATGAGGTPVGMIDLTDGIAPVIDHLSPKGLKAMIAVSRLIWEKTGHQPLVNRGATLTIGEVARAMGYQPDKHRSLDPEIIRRVTRDLQLLTRIQTWAASGPYNEKTKHHPTGWAAPLLVIAGIEGRRIRATDEYLPARFDAMLGRNWAEAMDRFDVIQVAPGFMGLDEDSAIALGWYYTVEFRYQMTNPKPGVRRTITLLCEELGLETSDPKNRGRLLERLEGWHRDLQRAGVIGHFERDPLPRTDLPPSAVLAQGRYFVMPPELILAEYREQRRKAAARAPKPRKKAG
jgi:hypothetical protein